MAFQLQELGGGVGSFKGGLYGFAGGGKTHTATLFAIGIRNHFKLTGRIGFFDTETGVEYVNPMLREATGQPAIGAKSRSLQDAIDFILECEKAGVSVAIVDSTTHIWEEVQRSYLKQINESRKRRKLDEKTSIEWQDRNTLNEIWQKFTDAYINSKLHIIICGRAANIWEMEQDENGKKQLNKLGTKMKTQSDMAYEPSFLAEMARTQTMEGGAQKITRVMTVLKDRFRLLDGQQFENPTFASILPHIAMLTPGAVNAIDTSRMTDVGVTDDGNSKVAAERRRQAIYSEEIAETLVSAWPGQSAREKKLKTDVVFELLGTRSWEAIQRIQPDRLKAALEALPAAIARMNASEAPKVEAPKTEAAQAGKVAV